MNKIFTAGYSGHTPAQLKKAADQLNAVVIDIRLKPFSRVPGWSKNELQTLFGTNEGNRYLSMRELGNLAIELGGPMRLASAEIGIRDVLFWANRCPVILLCQCPEFVSCHRRMVSDLLKEHGIQTQELSWPEVETAGTIKCISLWQPWASLITIGAKQIETRHWATSYRGPIAIHAAKTEKELDLCMVQPYERFLKRAGLLQYQGLAKCLLSLPLGKIVAVAELKDCVATDELQISEQERAFGNYAPGRFAWILEDIRPLKEPLPCRGAQRLFNVPLDMLKESYD